MLGAFDAYIKFYAYFVSPQANYPSLRRYLHTSSVIEKGREDLKNSFDYGEPTYMAHFLATASFCSCCLYLTRQWNGVT